MTEESRMSREIIRLASPIIVGMISHTVLNLVDTLMVSRLGETALASVGLGSMVILVSVLVFGSLNIGTQAITSRRLGEGKSESFEPIFHSVSLLALLVGITVSVLGYILSPWLFSLLSDKPEVVGSGTPYLSIRFLGLFSIVVIFTLRGFTYGIARPRLDMIMSIGINILNIVLNYFLIFGHWIFPRMEVEGAAIASVVSTGIGFIIYQVSITIFILRPLKAPPHGRRISARLMAAIVKISAPRALQSASIAGFIVFMSFIGRLGVGELAISNIIYKAFNLSFMIGLAIGTASATLVGRSLGEGDKEKAVNYGWHSVGLGALMMGAIGTLFMFLPREIMGIFVRDAVTIEKGVLPFRLLGAFQILDGVAIVLSRTLQGVGSTLFVMVSQTICIWCVMVPFSYLAVEMLDGGIVMAWWGFFLYIITFSMAVTWKYREGGWLRIEI